MNNEIVETETVSPVVIADALKTDLERLAEWTKAGVVVTNQTQRDTVAIASKAVRGKIMEVNAAFDEILKRRRAAWQRIVDEKKSYTDILTAFKEIADDKILDYDNEQEEKRLAEQRRLQAIADEKARKERDALLKRAETLKTPEKKEEALAAAAAVTAPAVEIASTVEKQKGETTKTNWRAKIISINMISAEHFRMLFGYFNDSQKESALNAMARATKGNIEMAGIQFYTEQTLSMRR